MILLIIASVYAIVGTTFFFETSPEYFANFHTSLFTMFQVRSTHVHVRVCGTVR